MTLHVGVHDLGDGMTLRLRDHRLFRLNDGGTYEAVTLDCVPGAGASSSQVFLFRDDAGTPHPLGEPITLADRLSVEDVNEMDNEGIFVSSLGYSADAPDCCPDQKVTYMLTITTDGVRRGDPDIQPYPSADVGGTSVTPALVTVPNVIGTSKTAARRALASVGLRPAVVHQGATGTIVGDVQPRPGSQVAPGTTIWIRIPANPPQYVAPPVPQFGNGAMCGITVDATYVC